MRPLINCCDAAIRKHAAHFEDHKAAFEEGGGSDDTVMEDDEKGMESFREVSLEQGNSNA